MKSKPTYFIVKATHKYAYHNGRFHRAYKVGDELKLKCGSIDAMYEYIRNSLEIMGDTVQATPAQICGNCWRQVPVTLEAN